VPGEGPPFAADAPVGISAPVAKALAAKQAITDFGNMAPPPSRRLYWKMGRDSPLSTGRDACFIVRYANGQALAYGLFRGRAGTARGGQAPHPRRGPAHRVNIAAGGPRAPKRPLASV